MSEERDAKKPVGSFADLVDSSVEPFEGRNPPPQRAQGPRPRRSLPEAEAVRFEITTRGEEVEGRAPGVAEADLGRILQSVAISVTQVDLHRMDADEARRAVLAALGQALRRGERWLHVIHGRGHRSEAGPVLKEALPGWLAELPHGRDVLAFLCSERLPGATGATRVWLRRPRAPSPR